MNHVGYVICTVYVALGFRAKSFSVLEAMWNCGCLYRFLTHPEPGRHPYGFVANTVNMVSTDTNSNV